MRFATINYKNSEQLAVYIKLNQNNEVFFIPIEVLNTFFNVNWALSIEELLNSNFFDEFLSWIQKKYQEIQRNIISQNLNAILAQEVKFCPLYRNPSKIWGIGLNYKDHARDLNEIAPETFPASFIKGKNTIIGYQDPIIIPALSHRTTGEAELGIIIKKKCKNVPRSNWKSVVAGFVPILDMTAEDILRQNPRYLTLSKNFDSFFSFGPILITPDEFPEIAKIKVSTVINGQIHASNFIYNMTFPPDYLVSFHSKVMTLYPGDIISTGTPRAVPLKDGDVLECLIDGFPTLVNPVIKESEK
ncbi:fumarylacetoacetate hydrolase family protein [Candidatus Harpocratesius sp.]